tara:strand:- start:455 stop:1072 length:618 start_codon:yes stop_codon:yes gene_type:complete
MYVDNQILDLFPTRLNLARHNDEMIEMEIDRLVERCLDQEPSFNFNAEHNETINLFCERRAELLLFLPWLEGVVNKYLGHNHWKFTESWLNVYTTGGSQPPHNHLGCQVSGCYYHRTTPSMGPLVFHNPHNFVDLDLYGMQWKTFPVDTYPNSTILFPHWLKHSTEPNKDDSAKISIGFNITIDPAPPGGISGKWLGGNTKIHEP